MGEASRRGAYSEDDPFYAGMRRLHDDLARRGKLIEAGWIGLRIIAVPKNAPQIQLDEMRNAFMAGAQHLFRSILFMLDPDSEPTEADMRRMQQIHNELETFIADFEKKHGVIGGRSDH